MENARLLNELSQRTTDLTESLEQQTTTSEVLQIISSLTGELKPMFQAMLEKATRICEANFGTLNLYENGAFPNAATHKVPEPYAELRRHRPGESYRDRHWPPQVVDRDDQARYQITIKQKAPRNLRKHFWSSALAPDQQRQKLTNPARSG
jgi:hypothetical protein